MNDTNWILIDTETTGFAAPIIVVELAAQRMRGWEPDGPFFRRVLNQNAEIPPEASRVHGYTREILERDGEPAPTVYRDFARYANGLPIVAFNLEYDLDNVLKPEWKRLGVAPIGTSGFCALELARRLLDPVPAGNCKLQTLRQYYRLPERGAHTALGDVQTVVDLLANVLRPIAESRGLHTWSDICAYVETEWFPTRLAFGKFKGRHFQEARTDAALRAWLESLVRSTNARTVRMGRWYLELLDSENRGLVDSPLTALAGDARGELSPEPATSLGDAIVVFVNPDVDKLRQLIAAARSRLADVEAQYTKERHSVDATRATIFGLLRNHYQARDRLRLIVDYRAKFIKTLLRGGEEDAAQVAEEFKQAQAQSDSDYEKAAADASVDRKELTEGEQRELTTLWRKLVRLYHPDRFANQPDKIETYDNLTGAINRARDKGDIDQLREIANDPQGFILRQGWASLDFSDSAEIESLRRLFETLQTEILALLNALNELHESADFELHRLSMLRQGFLEQVALEQAKAIDLETAQLNIEAERLSKEIAELTGDVNHIA